MLLEINLGWTAIEVGIQAIRFLPDLSLVTRLAERVAQENPQDEIHLLLGITCDYLSEEARDREPGSIHFPGDVGDQFCGIRGIDPGFQECMIGSAGGYGQKEVLAVAQGLVLFQIRSWQQLVQMVPDIRQQIIYLSTCEAALYWFFAIAVPSGQNLIGRSFKGPSQPKINQKHGKLLSALLS
jgi:hypothetical protein